MFYSAASVFVFVSWYLDIRHHFISCSLCVCICFMIRIQGYRFYPVLVFVPWYMEIMHHVLYFFLCVCIYSVIHENKDTGSILLHMCLYVFHDTRIQGYMFYPAPSVFVCNPWYTDTRIHVLPYSLCVCMCSKKYGNRNTGSSLLPLCLYVFYDIRKLKCRFYSAPSVFVCVLWYTEIRIQVR